MPIYEYECEACGSVTDLKHAFREAPPTTTCPSCGVSPLKRKFNAAGIVFKGSGFYVNDSRSSNGASAASKGEPAKADAGSKSDGPAKSDAPAKASEASTSGGGDKGSGKSDAAA